MLSSSVLCNCAQRKQRIHGGTWTQNPRFLAKSAVTGYAHGESLTLSLHAGDLRSEHQSRVPSKRSGQECKFYPGALASLRDLHTLAPPGVPCDSTIPQCYPCTPTYPALYLISATGLARRAKPANIRCEMRTAICEMALARQRSRRAAVRRIVGPAGMLDAMLPRPGQNLESYMSRAQTPE